MRITVVGLGYIGLPTACLLATKNNDTVYGYDTNSDLISQLNAQTFVTKEIGLDGIMYEVIKSGKLVVDRKLNKSDVYIIAVPTPFNEDKTCDISYIKMAVSSVASILEKGNLIILESTVSPGVTENVCKRIIEDITGFIVGQDILLAYSAERVIPGRIIEELKNNDRIIGGVNLESAKRAAEVYQIFVEGEIHLTDCTTAEVTKIMENTYRDVNIALANEFAKLAEKLGFNVWEAIRLANKHPRVNIHEPGPGVGGHCIAVDPWFFVGMDHEDAVLINAAREINDYMPFYVFEKIRAMAEKLNIKNIGILGVSYKPDIDDIRNSPSSALIEILKSNGFTVYIHDPIVKKFAYALSTTEDLLCNSELLVLMVAHRYYQSMDFTGLLNKSKVKAVLDTKNKLVNYIKNDRFITDVLGKANYLEEKCAE